MKVIIVENYEEASQEAAKIFINQVKEKPNSILWIIKRRSWKKSYII